VEAIATSQVSRARLEFLVDGIFAIAMTILVLELKVPELEDRHSITGLAHGLAEHASTFISYLLSFGMLGLLWFHHNSLYRHVTRITLPMFAMQLVQLAAAASFPFCAALFGRYAINSLAQFVYVTCVAIYMWAGLVSWVTARRSGALDERCGPELYDRLRKGSLRGAIVPTVLALIYFVRLL
jgi:uncharacterized membrane protein